MTGNERLYLEIRNFVGADKVNQFDVDFFQRRHTYKSMYNLINKYVDIKVVLNKFRDPKAKIAFAKIQNKLLFDPKFLKEIKKCNDMAPHYKIDFLIKNSQYN